MFAAVLGRHRARSHIRVSRCTPTPHTATGSNYCVVRAALILSPWLRRAPRRIAALPEPLGRTLFVLACLRLLIIRRLPLPRLHLTLPLLRAAAGRTAHHTTLPLRAAFTAARACSVRCVERTFHRTLPRAAIFLAHLRVYCHLLRLAYTHCGAWAAPL